MSAYVGRRVERIEDERFVTGRGQYVDDLGVDAVHAVFVRSDHAHARVSSVEVDRVLETGEVLAVYTANDLDGRFAEPLPVIYPHASLRSARTPCALAGEEVCYVGQPIAMVIAQSRYAAEDAAAAIRVHYEPLPAAVDLEASARGEQGPTHIGQDGNIAAEHSDSRGDVDAAFAAAEHILSFRLVCERASGAPLEGRGLVARFDEEREHLSVADSTQMPLLVRGLLADRFGVDPEAIDVLAPDVGGGFGTKGFRLYPEEVLVPWASRRLGLPVKWIEDRREHFVASTHQRSQIHDVRVGCTSEGRIVALDVEFLHDMGAFCQMGLLLPLVTGSLLSGSYAIPNLRYRFRAIYTNTGQTGPYRGAAAPFAAFVVERTLDHVARELGLDRAEVRRRNFVPRRDFPYDTGLAPALGTGTVVYDSGDFHAGLEQVLEAIGWESFEADRARAASEGRRIGIGLACGVEGNGVGPYETATAILSTDGTVHVSVAVASTGQGHETVFAQVAADVLGVPLARIRTGHADSRRVPNGFGTYASRSAVVAGNAVAQAAAALRDAMLTRAARLLAAPIDNLEFGDDAIRVVGDPKREITFETLARAATFAPPAPGETPGLRATGSFAPPGATLASNVHAAIVEIDPITYDMKILRYVAQHDCGRVINPMIVEGQIVGGVAHGIADAFFERRFFDESGQLLNASFMDYLMPFATEIPEIELRHTETPAPGNPLGLKGAGEGGTIPAAATIISALEDALGVPLDRTPQSPLTLFEQDGHDHNTP